MAASLVRTGRRMSDMMMDAPWTLAHVDRPSGARHRDGTAGKLSDALKLAEQLGGRSVVLSGDDVVRAIMDHAHNNHVTQIVLAKGRDSRLSEWLGRSLAVAATSAGLAAGAEWVSLGVYDDNVAARRLYDALGFRTDARYVQLAPAARPVPLPTPR